MRSNRRKNWFIKRIALGLAIAAVAAPVAQAKVDEGSSVQANGYQAFATDFPPRRRINVVPLRSVPTGSQVAFGVTRSSSSARSAARPATTSSPPTTACLARCRGLRARTAAIRSRSSGRLPNGTPSDKIEFVRTQPRSIGEPQVVSAGFDWKDAGIGAGLALALVLLGVGAALVSRHAGRAQTA